MLDIQPPFAKGRQSNMPPNMQFPTAAEMKRSALVSLHVTSATTLLNNLLGYCDFDGLDGVDLSSSKVKETILTKATVCAELANLLAGSLVLAAQQRYDQAGAAEASLAAVTDALKKNAQKNNLGPTSGDAV
jgi:hypothetical protein